MKRLRTIFIGLLFAFACVTSYANQVYFDVYKTSQFTLADLQPELNAAKRGIKKGKEAYIHNHLNVAMDDYKKALEPLLNKIMKKGKYKYINVSMVAYPKDPNTYVTFDVVDKSDASRMPVYRAAPKGHFADPENLIKDWQSYEATAMPLLMTGKIPSDIKHCTEFHCLGEFSTPRLKKYEVEFNAEVPKHQEELANIVMNDANKKSRESAVFLLAHTTNENQLIQWLIPALDDADAGVRNAASRILIFMAEKDQKITLPVDKFITMISSPTATDRNKTLYILLNLSVQPRYAAEIKAKAGQGILDNLRLTQPNLHLPAYKLLEKISGQHYNDRDYAAWSHWLGLS